MFSFLVPMGRLAPAGVRLALLAACATAQAAPVGLELRPEALVRGPSVRLGDVAAIDAASSDAAGVRRLAALPVGGAPLAGYPATFSRAALAAALVGQAGFAGLSPAWRGAERVVVRRAAALVDGAALQAVAQRRLEALYGARHARLELTPLGVPAAVQAPEGVLALRARDAAVPLAARTTVWVDVLVDGALVRSVTVPFQVRAWNPVLVARRDLAAGAALAAADLRSEQRDVLAPAAGGPPAAAPASWDGVRLAGALAEGEVLAARQLVPAGAVRRGDRVRLLVQDAALRIETAAVAQEDGVSGARVRVLPASGSEAVAARVLGHGVVAIEGL